MTGKESAERVVAPAASTHSPTGALFVAAFSRYHSLLDQLPGLLARDFSPVVLVSERFAFEETAYYRRTMGDGLYKQLFACRDPIFADALPTLKRRAIALENTVAKTGHHEVPRPLNLDPGFLDLGKVVLASTKDHAHRLYLGQGIFGEVTLHYERRARQWLPHPWTYPDYRRDDVRQFFLQLREHFRGESRSERG